jgi:hypothetical protein
VVLVCATSFLLLKSGRSSSKIAYSTPSARGALAAAVAGNSLDEVESLTVTIATDYDACYQLFVCVHHSCATPLLIVFSETRFHSIVEFGLDGRI